MRCKTCQGANLFPSRSHPFLVRLALLLLLLHKFRCPDCLGSQIEFLPRFWLELLIQRLVKN